MAEDGLRSVYVDPSTLNYHLASLAETLRGKIKVVTGKSPVPLRKAVKNEVEIAGMKEAHMEDGLADGEIPLLAGHGNGIRKHCH